MYIVRCRMCPIFQVSNVTGENLTLLRMFLNLLSTRMPCDYSAPAEFQIDETFAVPVCSSHCCGFDVGGLRHYRFLLSATSGAIFSSVKFCSEDYGVGRVLYSVKACTYVLR